MAVEQPAALQKLGTAMGGPQPPSIDNGHPFLFSVVPKGQFWSDHLDLQAYTEQLATSHAWNDCMHLRRLFLTECS